MTTLVLLVNACFSALACDLVLPRVSCLTGDASSFFATVPVDADLLEELADDFVTVFRDADRDRERDKDLVRARPRLLLLDFDLERLVLFWNAFSTLERCEMLLAGSHVSLSSPNPCQRTRYSSLPFRLRCSNISSTSNRML